MIRSQLLTVAVTSMCLLACGSARDPGGGRPDGGGAPGSLEDVHGRVVGPTGVALSGLSVGIGEKTAVTDLDGRFFIPGVAPPYDLNVVLAGTPLYVGRYEGLTRPDPTIAFLLLYGTGEPNTATIAGTVSGGEAIGTAGVFTTAFFTTPDVRFDFTAIGITSRNNPFTLPVSWFGPRGDLRNRPRPAVRRAEARRPTHRLHRLRDAFRAGSRPRWRPHRRGHRPHRAREREHRRDDRSARRLPGAREDARAGGLGADRHPARPRGQGRHGLRLHRPGGNPGDGRRDGQRAARRSREHLPPVSGIAPGSTGVSIPSRRPPSPSLRTTGRSSAQGRPSPGLRSSTPCIC